MTSSAGSRLSREEVLALLEAEDDVEEGGDVDEVFFPGSDEELGFYEEEEEEDEKKEEDEKEEEKTEEDEEEGEKKEENEEEMEKEEEGNMSDDNEDGLAFQYICSHLQLLYVNMHIHFTDREEEPMAQVNISSLRCVSIRINQVTVAPPNGQLYLSLSCTYLQL